MGQALYLVLENGRVFAGESFGAAGEVCGEVVFTTGMTGYVETLSDPSYHGQMVVQSFPLIGNYGVMAADLESGGPQVAAYIVSECCAAPSNFRMEHPLDGWLRERGIVGLCGVDTRALVRTLREAGTMNGVITDDPSAANPQSLRALTLSGAVAAVSGGEVELLARGGGHRVALWDFGAKANIARELAARGCTVLRLPHNATAAEIRALGVDGIMLSNGPGDPQDNARVIAELKMLLGAGIPMFGICLGHQLLALAAGGDTVKLKYGHRGLNHPVRELRTGRVRITSQNHGYAVLPDSIDPAIGTVSHINANDGTCEGVEYRAFPAFSVQFHPEASAGPRDTAGLFDQFIEMMGGADNAAC